MKRAQIRCAGGILAIRMLRMVHCYDRESQSFMFSRWIEGVSFRLKVDHDARHES